MSCNLTCENCSLLDISGLCNPSDVTNVISENPYWIQMNIPEYLTIPEAKPDMEEINSITISVDIFRKEVIEVPVSPVDVDGNFIPNLEGKISTGRKLIIEGQLCQKVVYTADLPSQPVHGAEFYVPFSAYIVVPPTFTDANDEDIDSLNIDFQVNACIEDVAVKMIDLRHILKQVTLLLYAVPNLSV
ncbi:hypothetical protein TPDSL_09090 [Terrisporobacter petrolearius]|uniref:DUF3794 domain-containing protein n=1 Tax=Terrisporobacter petrolearius TaxID=1460447 RepID=UPI0008F15118|nr:protein of unknown function [Terrisporobacter glycolicus]